MPPLCQGVEQMKKKSIVSTEPICLKVYTVYDKLAEEAGPPFYAKNHAIALRNYNKLLEQTNTPNDYELYHVGFWFPEQIKLDCLEMPSKVEEV